MQISWMASTPPTTLIGETCATLGACCAPVGTSSPLRALRAHAAAIHAYLASVYPTAGFGPGGAVSDAAAVRFFGSCHWFYGGGAGRFFPELWARFAGMIPEEERDDLIAAYHRRLFSGDVMAETRFARAWTAWENALAAIGNDGPGGEGPADYARAFARLENHYFTNEGFLDQDGQILARADRLRGIPGHIVQGRYDMICPPEAAVKLHRAWPESDLHMVARAGHALSEPGISAELVRIMDRLRFHPGLGDLAAGAG